MRVEHVAVWTADLERLRDFYVQHFGAKAGPRYDNEARGFSSYFLSWSQGGARLELMTAPNVSAPDEVLRGWSHLALSLGNEAAVDSAAQTLARAGVRVVDGPRRTGDGYYECVVLDPDGNRIELTA